MRSPTCIGNGDIEDHNFTSVNNGDLDHQRPSILMCRHVCVTAVPPRAFCLLEVVLRFLGEGCQTHGDLAPLGNGYGNRG